MSNLNNTPRFDLDNYDPFGTNVGPTDNTSAPPASTQLNINDVNSNMGQTPSFQPGYGTPPKEGGWFSKLSLRYLQEFFDVQGDQVVQRAMASVVPTKGHLEANIKSSPDLYGPLWISVTLIVTSAVSHGIAQFIQDAPNCVAVDTDMKRTSFVATCVFLYSFLLPSALWAFLKYQGAETRQNLVSYMCLYGYSMTVFIPISIIWVTRLEMINWIIMSVGTGVTAYSLVSSLWPSLNGLQSFQSRLLVVIVVIAMHAGLAISLGAYAFAPTIVEAPMISPPLAPVIPPIVPSVVTLAPNTTH